MNILLVSPATPETFWSFKHAVRFVSKKAAFPPLGLLTVGAMLPREWNLQLVDLNVSRLNDAQLDWADYVLVSAMLVHADSVRQVVSRCRARGRTVVGGGPLFTTSAQRFPEVEHVVAGEAEPVMAELVADLAAGTLKPHYQAAQRPDVRLTPIPRWDLIDLHKYVTMPLQFSRGCPFNCEFCDIVVMNGRVPRVKEPAQMIGEIASLLAAGWRSSIFIVDDNFIGNKVKVKAFLRELIAWSRQNHLRLDFTTEASLNLVDDPELLDLLAQAGFRKIFIGIETPEESSLLECAKIQNTQRDLVAAVKRIQNAGIEVMGGFIVGFDGDGPNIFERQFRFIQEAGIATAMVGLLTALPGTRLFSRLSSEGRILEHSTGNNLDGMLNFVPRIDRELLTTGYKRLLKHLYTPKVYYRRIFTFLKEYRPQRPRPRLSRQELVAFARSLWVMGVWTRGRREYWKFLVKTLVVRPKAFAEAVTLAIVGYHFRKVAASL
ncbi:MAG: hypothetical protein AMXMBFR13_08870 [Phycisphaerae bacterium]